MCARFALCDQIEDIDETFGVVAPMWLTPRYNIAPGTQIACLSWDKEALMIEPMQWGILPHWAKSKSQLIINTREETAETKPLSKRLLAQQRCCVIASGYYEWHKDASGNKHPFYIQLPYQEPFAMAAIWQYAMREDGVKVKQCSILTAEASLPLYEIHHRMPVILDGKNSIEWMREQSLDAMDMIRDQRIKQLDYYPVSDYVNNARHDTSKCTQPLT